MVLLHEPARWEAERRLVQPGRQPRSEVDAYSFSEGSLANARAAGSDAVKEVAKCLDYCKAALANT
jgi:hypothetical protein